MAGFFDGEGCIQIVRQRSSGHYSWTHRLLVALTNTYQPIVEAYHKKYGGVLGSRVVPTGRKRVYYWHASGRRAEAFLKDVVGLLQEKRPQAELGLEFLRTKKITPAGRGRVPSDELERRDAYYWKLRGMKRPSLIVNHDFKSGAGGSISASSRGGSTAHGGAE